MIDPKFTPFIYLCVLIFCRSAWRNGYFVATQVQIRDKAVYVSFHANSLGKGMNPYLFPPFIGKLGRLGF